MTREEEIKARASAFKVIYFGYDLPSHRIAEADMFYLLARSKELQRRVDSALSIVNRRVEENTRYYKDGVLHINCHDNWALMSVLEGLDTKEQDDDQAD